MGTSNHRMRKHKYDEKVADKKEQKTTNISMNDVTNEYWKVNKGVVKMNEDIQAKPLVKMALGSDIQILQIERLSE